MTGPAAVYTLPPNCDSCVPWAVSRRARRIAPRRRRARVFFDGGRVVGLPEKTGAMLKAAGPLRWRRARES